MVMGGMWSLYVLTEVMIFMVVVRRVEAVARRTLARSVGVRWLVEDENVPILWRMDGFISR